MRYFSQRAYLFYGFELRNNAAHFGRLAWRVRGNTTGQTQSQGPEGTEYPAGSETSANSLFFAEKFRIWYQNVQNILEFVDPLQQLGKTHSLFDFTG